MSKTLEWRFIVGSSDPTFARENKTALCIDGEAIGQICRHSNLFYPVTAEGKTSASMFGTFDEAKKALEDHATGKAVLSNHVEPVRVIC